MLSPAFALLAVDCGAGCFVGSSDCACRRRLCRLDAAVLALLRLPDPSRQTVRRSRSGHACEFAGGLDRDAAGAGSSLLPAVSARHGCHRACGGCSEPASQLELAAYPWLPGASSAQPSVGGCVAPRCSRANQHGREGAAAWSERREGAVLRAALALVPTKWGSTCPLGGDSSIIQPDIRISLLGSVAVAIPNMENVNVINVWFICSSYWS